MIEEVLSSKFYATLLVLAMAAAWGLLTGKRTRARVAQLEEELHQMKQGKFYDVLISRYWSFHSTCTWYSPDCSPSSLNARARFCDVAQLKQVAS